MAGEKQQFVIGFVGTGVMGRSMAARLLKAGYDVCVYNRTKAGADSLVTAGARWMPGAGELAAVVDIVITMVGYPHDVEEVYFGDQGILERARPGSYLVDMTTSTPSLARRIHEEARRRELHAMDAPVSGGDVGARQGTLAIMAGGDEPDFQALLPVLSVLGQNIVLQGPAGAGQHTKMCNQIAIASGMIGVCEAMVYATRAGLDPARVLQSIGSGAAGSWSLSQLGPRMIAGDFAPGFYVKHFIKDMTIALEAAREMGLMTPGLELARRLYGELAAAGGENSGTQALYQLYASSGATPGY